MRRGTVVGNTLRVLNLLDALFSIYENVEFNPIWKPLLEFSPLLFLFTKIVVVGVTVSFIEKHEKAYPAASLCLVFVCASYVMLVVLHVVLLTQAH